jgi:hypothetical protein
MSSAFILCKRDPAALFDLLQSDRSITRRSGEKYPNRVVLIYFRKGSEKIINGGKKGV